MNKVSDSPTISVIIPVYNCADYLDQCVQSLLANENVNLEIIAVNDCSTDNSLSKLQAYGDKIKLIDLPQNGGASHARNVGLENATGEYVTFVDADDYVAPQMMATLLQTITTQQADVCIGKCRIAYLDGTLQTGDRDFSVNVSNQLETLKLFLENKISVVPFCKLIKREILDSVRFNQNLAVAEDILFCLEIFYHAQKVCFVNEYLYYYVQQPTSQMHVLSRKFLDFLKLESQIPEPIREYLQTNLPVLYDRLTAHMIARAVHSISVLTNRHNKKQSVAMLREICTKENILRVRHCRALGRAIRGEFWILQHFGIGMHLWLMPLYKLLKGKRRVKGTKKK